MLSCGHLFVVMPYATADCHDRFGMLNSFPPEDNSLLMLHIFKWLAFIMSWICKRSRLHFGYHVARAERLSTLFGIDGWKRWAKQQEKKQQTKLDVWKFHVAQNAFDSTISLFHLTIRPATSSRLDRCAEFSRKLIMVTKHFHKFLSRRGRFSSEK